MAFPKKSREPQYPVAHSAIKNALQQFRDLSEMLIPPQYCGSTDLSRCTESMRNFETSDHAGQTISEILDAYESNESLGKPSPNKVNEPSFALVDPARLQEALGRSSLEQYRVGKGLDKVRERLVEGLMAQISFETGLKRVEDSIDACKLVEERRREMEVLSRRKMPDELNAQEKVKLCFPDMTAEEVAWMSIAQVQQTGLLYRVPAPFFYPVTLVDMDIDGLRFAFGTIDETVEHADRAHSALQLAGVTDASDQYYLMPFDFNVKQAIKAIVMLSMNDDDIFRRLWCHHDEAAIRRGDAMMVKAVLRAGMQDSVVDWAQNLDQLRCQGVIGRVKIDQARSRVRAYARSKIVFIDSPVRTVLDFLHFMGMLERVPEFVLEQRGFQGYVRLFGTSMEFISESGAILDSVPLHDHLLLSTSYNFQDQISDISRRNKVAEQLFSRLRQAVYAAVVDGNHRLHLDECQASIFDDYQIYTPVSVTKVEREYDAVEMVRAHLADNIVAERTMKFGQLEFMIIRDIFCCVPEDLLKHVRSITKEMSHSNTLVALRAMGTPGGSYQAATKRITISLPIETPNVEHGMNSLLEAIMSRTSKKNGTLSAGMKLEEHKAYFAHVLLHEVGESLWSVMAPEFRMAWTALTPDSGTIRSRYLTAYARKSPSEDFCECFAIFFTHGRTFRKRAKPSPVLRLKYDFVKRLWCSDGMVREFPDLDLVSLTALHGDPDEDMLERVLREDIEEDLASERLARDYERTYFADRVLSYEALAEEMLEDEDEVNPFDKTARRQDHRPAQDLLEEINDRKRIAKIVSLKTEQELLKLKVCSLDVISRLGSCLASGLVDEAVKLLRDAGAKPKKQVKPTVIRLVRLYKSFEEELQIAPIDKEEALEFFERTMRLVEGIAEHNRKSKKKDAE